MKHLVTLLALVALLLCSCHQDKTNEKQALDITADMAFDGVNNYCHREYDWSMAEENPSMVYVALEQETDTDYQLVFRSYTGALVHFYVDKATGTTRMVESVPTLGVDSVLGTIDITDYLTKKKPIRLGIRKED